MVVVSAGPYANHLQLSPDRNHASTSLLILYRPDILPEAYAFFCLCVSTLRTVVFGFSTYAYYLAMDILVFIVFYFMDSTV